MTSLDNCTCPIRTYVSVNEGLTACRTCPKGGECQDRNLGCALRSSPFACPIVGAEFWLRDSSNDFILVGCPVGHKLENASGHDNLECQKCPEGFYVQDPRDPNDICRMCPSSATCINGAPPIFQVTTVSGQIQLAGIPEDGGDDAVRQMLADLLGIDISQINLGDSARRQQRRAGARTIVFEIVSDASSASNLAADLQSGNLAAQLSSQLSTQYNLNISVEVSGGEIASAGGGGNRQGESWNLVGGVYLLQACPVGYLLINTTVELSRCKECDAGKYSLSPTDGCNAMTQTCDMRECTGCPAGVTCSRGMHEAWTHFVPKPLYLLGSAVEARVVLPNTTYRLLCSDSGCAPIDADTADAASTNLQGEHVWEYDGTRDLMALTHCPPGHQLANSVDGKFNADLQKCKACSVGKYIIDQAYPCKNCPKGATCPDGFQFLSKATGAEWEEETALDGGIQKRILSCPLGWEMKRDPLFPDQDDCVQCAEGSYLVSLVRCNTYIHTHKHTHTRIYTHIHIIAIQVYVYVCEW